MLLSRIAPFGSSAVRKPPVGPGTAGIRNSSVFVLALVAALFLCAGAYAQTPAPFVANPLVPDTAVPGSNDLTVTINGVGFTAASVANWNGTALATTYVKGTQLTAVIPASDLATATTGIITVTNTGASSSNLVSFAVGNSHSTVGYFRADMATGNNPVGVAIGDLNGDGIPDMVIANFKDSTVSVYLGAGGGTFGSPTNYKVATNPINVVLGDMNNDGILDIITSSSGASKVTILLGKGDGTFPTGKAFSTGGSPQSLVVGDFNGDGKLDVATPNSGDNSVSVLLGNGDGTLQPPVNYTVGANPLDVKTADFNGDGILDLVVANNADSTISVLFGNGDGTFQPEQTYMTGAGPNGIGVADVNGDGFPDILTSDANHTVSVLLNSGTGTFPVRAAYASCIYPSYAVGLADLKNNGILDMIVPNFACGQITASWGKGDGTFLKGPAYYPVNSNPDGLAIADLNKDGNLDIVVLDEFANMATVLTQSGLAQPGVTPDALAFGAVQGGGKSANKDVTITNTTGAALTINSIALAGGQPGDFSIESNNCPASLAVNAKCTVAVAFTPQAAGAENALLAINDNVGVQAMELSGSGRLSFSMIPDSMLFKATLAGQCSTGKNAILTNISGIPLTIDSITMQGYNPTDFSQTNTCPINPQTLAGGASCTITVEECPNTYGKIFGTVIVLTDASTPKRAIALAGVAYEITYSPTSMNFLNVVVGQSSTMVATFNNGGSLPLKITGATFQGQNPAGTYTQTNTCANNEIPAESSCTVSITFTPQTEGTFTAVFSVVDADPTSPQQIQLTGTGTSNDSRQR